MVRPKTQLEVKLEAEIAAFSRPALAFGGPKRTAEMAPLGRVNVLSRSLATARQWDEAHPIEAQRRAQLIRELEVETQRADRAEQERESIERHLRVAGARLERSGVGERSLAAASEPQDTEALGVVKRWLAEKDLTWLVLCGPKGTGKSVAATWAVREVIRSGGTGAFRGTAALAKLSAFDAGAAELAHLKRVHLLVLDDFGTELLTEYARAQFHDLLDHRHENYGRTIITSNLMWLSTTRDGVTVPGLESRLGERLVDRMAQAGRRVQLAPQKSMRRAS